MTYLIILTITISAIWVLFDSAKKGAKNPAGWAIVVALLWVVGFPFYLYKRNHLAPLPDGERPVSGNRVVGLIAIAIIAGVFLFKTYKQEAIPACDAQEVISVLQSLLPETKITLPAQRPESPEFGDIRLCNATVSGYIQAYNVRWYSNDRVRFIVNLE